MANSKAKEKEKGQIKVPLNGLDDLVTYFLINSRSLWDFHDYMEWRDKWFYMLMYDLVFAIGEWHPSSMTGILVSHSLCKRYYFWFSYSSHNVPKATRQQLVSATKKTFVSSMHAIFDNHRCCQILMNASHCNVRLSTFSWLG